MNMPGDPGCTIPPRVQTVIQVLHYVQNAKRPGGCGLAAMSGDTPTAEDDLSPAQLRVESAALNLLNLYLSGEQDYGDVPPQSARRGNDDEPGVPQRVPQPS